MTNPRQRITSTIIQSVLTFIKPFATKKLMNEINILLAPCCAPIITVCQGTGEITVTISDSILGGKSVAVIASNSTYSTIVGSGLVTLDKNGIAELDITTSSDLADYMITIIPSGLNVTHNILVEDVQAC